MLFSRFFQLVLYMYDYNDKNTVGKTFIFLIQSILYFLISFRIMLS